MLELADAFAAHDLPAGFMEAAATAYSRLADLQDVAEPSLDDVLALLLTRPT